MVKKAVYNYGTQRDDHYDVKAHDPSLAVRVAQALGDVAPRSAYSNELNPNDLPLLFARVRALRADLAAGDFITQNELAHAEVFADQLDQAQELFDGGYLVAAAVTAGSAGEAHLRRLAVKNGVDVERPDGSAIKASKINEDLAKKPVYDATTAKYVVAWQGTRNDAAHGHGEKVTPSRVADLIGGLRGFMRDYPA